VGLIRDLGTLNQSLKMAILGDKMPEIKYALGDMKVVALSIAGPFAYWMASGHSIERWGAKSIELRPWTRNNFRNVMVLLHISSNTSFDCFFDQMDFSLEKAPKFSIVGAAILGEIRKYEDAELFERDRRSHCWLGDETHEQVVEQYGIHPYGHVMTRPILFDKPILDVPGDRGYWVPNPKKEKQFDRQERAFTKAMNLLEKQYQLAA
jgi:hypothetical protein